MTYEALAEMAEEIAEKRFYNAIMNDSLINEAFSSDVDKGYDEFIAHCRWQLLRYITASDAIKRVLAEDFGRWMLENAHSYIKDYADDN